jgi:hypothetical protein
MWTSSRATWSQDPSLYAIIGSSDARLSLPSPACLSMWQSKERALRKLREMLNLDQ